MCGTVFWGSCGALLGTAGAILQVVMRNNLAEPGITGVTAGGILVAVVWMAGFWGLPHPGRFMPLVVLLGRLGAGGGGGVSFRA